MLVHRPSVIEKDVIVNIKRVLSLKKIFCFECAGSNTYMRKFPVFKADRLEFEVKNVNMYIQNCNCGLFFADVIQLSELITSLLYYLKCMLLITCRNIIQFFNNMKS